MLGLNLIHVSKRGPGYLAPTVLTGDMKAADNIFRFDVCRPATRVDTWRGDRKGWFHHDGLITTAFHTTGVEYTHYILECRENRARYTNDVSGHLFFISIFWQRRFWSKNRVPIDRIYWHVILKWNAVTKSNGRKSVLCWQYTQIAKFMGPTWGPPGSCRPQMGPMLAPWT